MKKPLIIILVIVTCSCGDNGLKMTVYNQSEFPISNVIISTDDSIAKLEFKKIEVGQLDNGFLNMNDIKFRDWSYRIEFVIDSQDREMEFGYYTNGYPLESKIDITIETDTIFINGKLGYL